MCTVCIVGQVNRSGKPRLYSQHGRQELTGQETEKYRTYGNDKEISPPKKFQNAN